MGIFVDLQTSDQSFNERKLPFLKAVGINLATKHTPLVLEMCHKHFRKLYKGQKLQVDDLAVTLPFDIVSSIIFGTEMNDKVEHIEYENPETGERTFIPFYECVSNFVNDLYYVEGEPISFAFPFLRHKRLLKSVKAISGNNNRMMKNLKEAIQRNYHEHSAYAKVLKLSKHSEDTVLYDAVGVMAVGRDLSHMLL